MFPDMQSRQPPFSQKSLAATTTTLLLFLPLLLLAAAFIISCFFIHPSKFSVDFSSPVNKTVINSHNNQNPPEETAIPLNCTIKNQTFCSKTQNNTPPSEEPECPDYFRWIHEDLRPWNVTGITKDMVERAKRTAHFRLVIVNGKAYVEKYRKSIQTRDLFTIWGILQLLRRYPGKLPDLELMFDCDDQPVVKPAVPRGDNVTVAGPPPLFRYCGNKLTVDIVFPDWSFWGWAEINIKPWESVLREIKEGNNRIKWMDREPYAYWKGNPSVAETRKDLFKCNVSNTQDWNARLYVQDWILEGQQGFRQSDLASQCTHRYKIYIEGYAWSVSEKYILACDSVTLYVTPRYYDFFIRSLNPLQHYWPIRDNDKCRSIKFAVDYGNSHKQKAQEIGRAASKFIQEDLKMDYVYDYMFHLLNEYAKLLKFKPEVAKSNGAMELCPETMVFMADGREKKFMMESMVNHPSATNPCKMPPPHEPHVLAGIATKRLNAMRQVQEWENHVTGKM